MTTHERDATILQARVWAERGRLYAIVDATDTPDVPRRADAAGARAVSLYRGRAEEELFAIAPFLFSVDAETLEWITGDLWSGPWGIFALSDASLEEMRSHFRRFLTVESPEGESWYFRFYDPRVLPTYLATCTPAELTAFFGPVRGFAVTNNETYGLTVIAPGAAPPPPATPVPAPQRIVVRR
jgi:hypothetical protein